MGRKWNLRVGTWLVLSLILLNACSPVAETGQQPAHPPAQGAIQVREADNMTMVFVPAGEFQMGIDKEMALEAKELCSEYSTPELARATCSLGVFSNEMPVHTVHLAGFWLDRFEVTNAQYQRCVAVGACSLPARLDSYSRTRYYSSLEYADFPVIWVTWGQAAKYCAWAGGRLPSEAEWEYAARGPEGFTFPWGNVFEPERLNYCDRSCEGVSDPGYDDGYPDTAPVGSFPAGASWIGAHDLAGNVREWVADWYGYYVVGPISNPTGPETGSSRIPRGGSWYDRPDDTRSTNRGENTPDYTRHKVGFRCAAD